MVPKTLSHPWASRQKRNDRTLCVLSLHQLTESPQESEQKPSGDYGPWGHSAHQKQDADNDYSHNDTSAKQSGPGHHPGVAVPDCLNRRMPAIAGIRGLNAQCYIIAPFPYHLFGGVQRFAGDERKTTCSSPGEVLKRGCTWFPLLCPVGFSGSRT